MYCTNCGRMVEESSVFCSGCGADLTKQKEMKSIRNKKRVIIVLVVFFLFLIIGFKISDSLKKGMYKESDVVIGITNSDLEFDNTDIFEKDRGYTKERFNKNTDNIKDDIEKIGLEWNCVLGESVLGNSSYNRRGLVASDGKYVYYRLIRNDYFEIYRMSLATNQSELIYSTPYDMAYMYKSLNVSNNKLYFHEEKTLRELDLTSLECRTVLEYIPNDFIIWNDYLITDSRAIDLQSGKEYHLLGEDVKNPVMSWDIIEQKDCVELVYQTYNIESNEEAMLHIFKLPKDASFEEMKDMRNIRQDIDMGGIKHFTNPLKFGQYIMLDFRCLYEIQGNTLLPICEKEINTPISDIHDYYFEPYSYSCWNDFIVGEIIDSADYNFTLGLGYCTLNEFKNNEYHMIISEEEVGANKNIEEIGIVDNYIFFTLVEGITTTDIFQYNILTDELIKIY